MVCQGVMHYWWRVRELNMQENVRYVGWFVHKVFTVSSIMIGD
jgi:hypothetical protein